MCSHRRMDLQVPQPQWPLQVPGGRPWSFTWDGISGQTYRDSMCYLSGKDRPESLAGLRLALALEQCPRRRIRVRGIQSSLGCLGTKSGAWALVSEGVTAGESQRIEGASGKISGSCTSNRKSGLRKEQRARRCNGLPSSFAWASMLDGYYVCWLICLDSLTSHVHSAHSTVLPVDGMMHNKYSICAWLSGWLSYLIAGNWGSESSGSYHTSK